MKTHRITTQIKIILIFALGISGGPGSAQRSMPEVLDTGTIQEQLDYLEERTRIYNDFRAIREDMFQRIKTNANDSLTAEKNNVLQLQNQIRDQSNTIESLQADLQNTSEQLDLAVKNKNRLSFIGIPVHKVIYNTIMWAVIAVLGFLVGILFLSNKRVLSNARQNKTDLEEIREEFEAYRKQTRERQEQLVVKHHNELRKLKGK